MTDPLAMNVNQPALNESELSCTPQPVAKPRVVRVARLISNILAPTTISVPMVLLVAFYQASSIGR